MMSSDHLIKNYAGIPLVYEIATDTWLHMATQDGDESPKEMKSSISQQRNWRDIEKARKSQEDFLPINVYDVDNYHWAVKREAVLSGYSIPIRYVIEKDQFCAVNQSDWDNLRAEHNALRKKFVELKELMDQAKAFGFIQ